MTKEGQVENCTDSAQCRLVSCSVSSKGRGGLRRREARAPSQACGVTPTVHILRRGQGRPTAGSRSRLPRNTLGIPRVIPKEEKLILSEVTWNLDIKIFQRTHMNLNLVSCGITYQSVEEAP